jgi:hypothetical protein
MRAPAAERAGSRHPGTPLNASNPAADNSKNQTFIAVKTFPPMRQRMNHCATICLNENTVHRNTSNVRRIYST